MPFAFDRGELMNNDKFQKGYHVEEINYYYSPEHCLLGLEGEHGVFTDNIGKNGEHLTIAVLSMNRASLTIRLMNSIKKFIPEFAGEFLIGDNGSDHTEKDKLYNAMQAMPYRCRMIEFGQNYGVAGGRNRLFYQAKTDWILSADNDLYFVGNPLTKIQNDIKILGCHFLAIPIANKENNSIGIYGGHIYVENLTNDIGLGGSSLYFSDTASLNVEKAPFLCTFVPGGAAIINKKTFYSVGGFDENMFVGFEDTEFSLRLFQKGIKIGGCGIISIIHDHPKPEITADKNYEKKRFSTNKLRESGQYFEKKHGFSVWNFTSEQWIKKRLNELVLDQNEKLAPKSIHKNYKVALIVDRKGWALDNIANQIIKNLSDEFYFKKIYLDPIDCLAAVLLMAKDCDFIHFLWRPLPAAINDDYTKQFIYNLRLTETEFRAKYINDKVISVAVYDHFFLDGADKQITSMLFSDIHSIVDCYTVSSKRLNKVYCEDDSIILKPSMITQDGVDCQLFRPINLERFEKYSERVIRIGWVGNSKWQVGESIPKDLKGIHTIIKPAVEELSKEGYKIELVTSDRNDRMIPHAEMPLFYSTIDIYACASECEGTPNPVLESMACGVPIISTNVGIVEEVFGPKQKEYILSERSVKCFKDTLKKLLDYPEHLQVLSQENLQYIQKWDWSIMVEKFRSYFNSELSKKKSRGKTYGKEI